MSLLVNNGKQFVLLNGTIGISTFFKIILAYSLKFNIRVEPI